MEVGGALLEVDASSVDRGRARLEVRLRGLERTGAGVDVGPGGLELPDGRVALGGDRVEVGACRFERHAAGLELGAGGLQLGGRGVARGGGGLELLAGRVQRGKRRVALRGRILQRGGVLRALAVQLVLEHGAGDRLDVELGGARARGRLGGVQPRLGRGERSLEVGDAHAQLGGAGLRRLGRGGQLGGLLLERGRPAPELLEPLLELRPLVAQPVGLAAGGLELTARAARLLGDRGQLGGLGLRALALLGELTRTVVAGGLGDHAQRLALRLEHREPHRVARPRDLGRPHAQPPVLRLGAESRERAERAGQRGLASRVGLGRWRGLGGRSGSA